MIVKHRRGTTQEWQEIDLIPEQGELVIEECTDGTLKCKLGNGHSKFSELPYVDDEIKKTLLKELANLDTKLSNNIASVKETLSDDIYRAKQALYLSINSKYDDVLAEVNTINTN